LRTWTTRLRRLGPALFQGALAKAAFAALVTVVIAVGYLQGSLSIVLTLPALLGGSSIVVLQAVMACLTVSGLFVLSAAILAGQLAVTEDSSLPEAGPPVTAIVPVHQDASVLHRSVGSLLDGRYRNLRVRIVVEPDDEASIERAQELASDDRVEVLVNTRYSGSKAGAINYAAEETDSDYLAVFDADERVDPRFVSAAVAKLADCDVVQGRTIPEPDGVVETVAYYESVVLGDLSQRVLSAITDFTMAASRTIVMRRTAFEAVGGYDPAMLTEDYAFAFDCYEADVDVVEHFSHASTIEGAHSVRDWWGQRKRWMTGYAQVLHTTLGDCLSARNYRTYLSPLICAGSVLGNLFMLQLVSKAAVLVINGGISWMVLPVSALVGSALALRAYDVRAARIDGIGVGYVAMPLILPLYSLAGLKAIVEYVLTWEGGWYSVAKGQ
jgi:cellulose synthase/poly-beta-1,6-N-acetylglucosamine synthase-like glycosyltransferase